MSRARTPKSVLITGATGAIGEALAEAYAGPGITLVLHGRNVAKLAQVAAHCSSKGAKVLTQNLDLRDTSALFAWVGAACVAHAVDLVIANAGMNTDIGPDGKGEDWATVEALLDINVKAAMATVNAALPAMRERGSGQLVLMSSLAAYYGLPVTPSYCASKAAVKTYGEALRGWLAPEGIHVNVVMPGYVESQMCRDMPGPKPFLWPADKAARAIKRGLASNQPRISFPFPLNVSSWLMSVIRPAESERIVRLFGYRG